MRFTIRDVLWLTVIAALSLALWIERRSIKTERASLQRQQAAFERERDSHRASMEKEWNYLQKATYDSKKNDEFRAEHAKFIADQVPEFELELAKQRSIDLGAPQPSRLPPGYGQRPK